MSEQAWKNRYDLPFLCHSSAPPSGHKRPLATHMRGTVLAFPNQDRSHTCSVRDRPTQLCIDRKAGRHSRPQGSGYVQYVPPYFIPDMLWYPGVGRSGSSPYRREATAASGSDLSTRQFIR
ncbi:unnamed protein product [Sphenostylis stenocarpa]|uniref:Uncharacterized protein n=1 Tax=Sphenostylis stenocarpa TaxID=92480 RepID=A0AA86VLY0_9FABA|nr:unnamed protein product [Sphenostylis stenocarpa]